MSKTNIDIQANGNKATVTIRGLITREMANETVSKLAELKSSGVKSLHVIMSSAGGSCFGAYDIGNAIKTFKKVSGEVGAVAASACSYLVAVIRKMGGTVTGAANCHTMIHKPEGKMEGNEDEIEANLKLLKNITADYKETYKIVLNKSDEEIEKMWANDYWANATESKQLNLLTDIGTNEEAITEDIAELFAEAGIEVIASVQTANKKHLNKMEKIEIIAQSLELEANATEAEIVVAAKNMAAKNKTLERENADMKAEIEANKKQRVKTLVDGLVAEDKITEAERASYEKLAEADYDSVVAIAKGLKAHKPFTRKETPGSSTDKYEGWDFEKYQKEDPTALAKMQKEDPDKFNTLKNAYVEGLKK